MGENIRDLWVTLTTSPVEIVKVAKRSLMGKRERFDPYLTKVH